MLYSRQQLLEQWMLRKYMIPLRTDCNVSRADNGIDYESMASIEMTDWYLNLLDTADPGLLDPVDIADETASVYHPSRKVLEITLPDNCRRVVSLSIKGHATPVVPVAYGSAEARLQQSEYSCGGSIMPVAVATGGKLYVYAADTEGNPPQITSIMAVTVPPDGFFRMNPRALSTITKSEL